MSCWTDTNSDSDRRYAIACVTSMGVRLTPDDRMSVQGSTSFRMHATSAETNVLNVASSLGYECLALTRFVEGSPIAAFIKAQLRSRNISFVGKDIPQGGPWGYRHQFNIADSGFGLRAPGSGMTGAGKSAPLSRQTITTSSVSSPWMASGSCICPG